MGLPRLIRTHLNNNNPEEAAGCYLTATSQFGSSGDLPKVLQELWALIEAAVGLLCVNACVCVCVCVCLVCTHGYS
jgi:hypothetical protein